mgnify:CR=1 FL=1
MIGAVLGAILLAVEVHVASNGMLSGVECGSQMGHEWD